MFLCEGTGLGMSYSDIVSLEVPVKERLLAMLEEELSELERRYEELMRGK